MDIHAPSGWALRIAAGVAIVFGFLTIVSGGGVLFGGRAAAAAAGNTVAFVLWFNFLSGFAYILAGVGIAKARHWAVLLSIGMAAAIAAVFALFVLHIVQGGAFEMRTVGAMSLRLVVWIAIAAVARRYVISREG
jgi:hypothetical protein